ncbi:MAG: PTS sugar transporter subunit IIA [Planctomycetota bacterium]
MSESDTSLHVLIGEREHVEDVQGATPDRVIAELLEFMSQTEGFAAEAITSMKKAILAREREATTGIGNGVAVPHLKNCAYVKKIRGIFGRSVQGVDWGATDGEPVHLFFVILTPQGQESQHIRVMKRIVRLSRDTKTLRYLTQTDNFANLHEILKEVDDQPD